MSKDGWRSWVSREEGAEFPPEKDRYHLFVSYACPWAHRALMTRALKGLEDVISVTVVHPIWQRTRPDDDNDKHKGWMFADPDGKPFRNVDGNGGPFPPVVEGSSPDHLYGLKSIRDLYEKAADTTGKYSVPILWDKKTETIVNNESAELVRMLNTEFNEFAKYPDLDLYPEDMREAIDEVNSWVLPTLNSGVYKCAWATDQETYDSAIVGVTEAFDKVDHILQKQRYMAGDKFTEADLRLFVSLLRFDEAYTVCFKTNTRSVCYTPSILNYCREIYRMPGVADTVNMEHIKMFYYCSHPVLNVHSVIPRGPGFMELLEQPHDRDSM